MRTQDAFIFVLLRCREAEQVYFKYARFLREIQDDSVRID